MISDQGAPPDAKPPYFDLPAFIQLIIILFTLGIMWSRSILAGPEYVIMELVVDGYWGHGKLLWIVNKDPVKTFCNCIHLKRQGRWGNNVYQLMQALHLASLARIPLIFVPVGFLFLSGPLVTTNGIEVRPGLPGPEHDCIYGKLYYYVEGTPLLNVSILDVFRDEYLKIFPEPQLKNDSLVMHMRSGDIFGWGIRFSIHRGYAQPPCKYYEDVMNMRNWSQIEVLSEDLRNPCTSYVMHRGALYTGRDVRTDLGYLLTSPNVVSSNGTFVRAAAIMSKKIVRLYTYDSHETWLPSHFNCVSTKEYRDKVIGKWVKSPGQIDMMINSAGCSEWAYVNRSEPGDWLFKNQLGYKSLTF